MDTLFVHGRKIAAKGAKNGSPFLGAKTPRNLLAQFHHPKIGFRLVVVKRHGKIVPEAQDLVLILMQTKQEIASLSLTQCSTLAFFALRRRVGGKPLFDKTTIACLKCLLNGKRQAGLSEHSLLINA